MCGRFSLTMVEKELLRERFHVDAVPAIKQSYNIAPTQETAIITQDHPNEIVMAKWGLIPHWAKDAKIGARLINARAETIAEKPAFKRPFASQRCLILADGFYEWKRVGAKKIPFRITLKDGLFAFAGIYDLWEKDGRNIVSCSIITTSPNAVMKPIHDRMPVILERKSEEAYLKSNPKEALKFLKPFPGLLHTYKVSDLVNSPQHNTLEVIQPVQS